MIVRFTLNSRPATKKTSNQIFPFIGGQSLTTMIEKLRRVPGGKGFHGACVRILMSEINFSVQPSKVYLDWFEEQYILRGTVTGALQRAGVKLPIMAPVNLQAVVYRDAERGDLLGYLQAIADAIQCDLWKCGGCNKKTAVLGKCPHCNAAIAFMTHSRKGLGIIGDDAQIVSLNGSELRKDADRPRIEITLTTTKAAQGGLFEE